MNTQITLVDYSRRALIWLMIVSIGLFNPMFPMLAAKAAEGTTGTNQETKTCGSSHKRDREGKEGAAYSSQV